MVARFKMSDLRALSYYLDVKSAFLNGELAETVFVKQAPCFTIKGAEHKVLKLRKALYELWQAPGRGTPSSTPPWASLGSLAALQSMRSTRGDGEGGARCRRVRG